uniref:SMP-30/Gluconolactonase/LRE-like region domain-containing protein n=1 Tax=Arcella intermedia TaxID=1963864 RepID=A0A6B2L785_9EUKA
MGICLDSKDNIIVADYTNHKIRRISPAGKVTTVAGSTIGFADGSNGQFNCPYDVCVDAAGVIYVSDKYNHKIRKITPSGTVTTIAGTTKGFSDGPIERARFHYPVAVAIDPQGDIVVSDQHNHKIRKISNGVVTTLSGNGEGFEDGALSSAQFTYPHGICVDVKGNIIVGDYGNRKVRCISLNYELINAESNERKAEQEFGLVRRASQISNSLASSSASVGSVTSTPMKGVPFQDDGLGKTLEVIQNDLKVMSNELVATKNLVGLLSNQLTQSQERSMKQEELLQQQTVLIQKLSEQFTASMKEQNAIIQELYSQLQKK